MGLDQYAHARKGEPIKKQETYTFTNEDGYEEKKIEEYDHWEDEYQLAQWRKHPNLQGWMESLYYEKGGEAEVFNCQDVELTRHDLISLEDAINGKDLPETHGFFFGTGSDDFYKEQDLQFILDARKALEDGYTVIYSSWW